MVARFADVRWLQFAFWLPLTVALLVAGLEGFIEPLDRPVLVASGLVLAANALCLIDPLSPTGRRLAVLPPVLDLTALGILTALPDLAPIVMLVALPALWLGLARDSPGTVLAIVAAPALVFGPWFASGDVQPLAAVVGLLTGLLVTLAAAVTGRAYIGMIREGMEQERRLRRAEAQVREGSALVETMLHHADVAILATDDEGRVLAANERFFLLDPVLRDLEVAAVAPMDDRRRLLREDGLTPLPLEDHPLHRVRAGLDPLGEVLWAGPGDGLRAYRVTGAAVEVDDDRRAYVLIYADVTSLMRALHHRRDFVAAISHELRSPLTSMVGYTELLSEVAGLPEEGERIATVLERNARRVLVLVNDLVSSPGSREVALARRPTALRPLVGLAVQSLVPRARDAGIDVRFAPGPDAVVPVDPDRFAQVVDNLVGNAIKYNRPGGTVRVVLDVRDERAVLEVRDTGRGIADADLDRVFARYQRAADVVDSVPGTGIGLAIVRSIVRAHGGVVEVDSVEGEGSTFRVTLPLRPEDGAVTERAASALAGPGE